MGGIAPGHKTKDHIRLDSQGWNVGVRLRTGPRQVWGQANTAAGYFRGGWRDQYWPQLSFKPVCSTFSSRILLNMTAAGRLPLPLKHTHPGTGSRACYVVISTSQPSPQDIIVIMGSASSLFHLSLCYSGVYWPRQLHMFNHVQTSVVLTSFGWNQWLAGVCTGCLPVIPVSKLGYTLAYQQEWAVNLHNYLWAREGNAAKFHETFPPST